MKHSIILALLFAWYGAAKSQTQLGEETVFTFGNRQLSVGDAFKINMSPTIYDSIVNIEEPTYLFIPRKVKTSYALRPIAPARLRVMEPLSKLNRVYVKAGIGLNTTPLVQVAVNQLRSKKTQVGLSFNHFSSDGGIKDVMSSEFSNNNLEAWGKYMNKKFIVETKLGYDRYVRHFYGYDVNDTTLTADNIKQMVNKIGGQVGVESTFRDSSKIQFKSNIGFSHLIDNYDAQEIHLVAKNTLSKFHEKEWYKLDVNVDFNQLNSINKTNTTERIQDNGIVELTPQILSKGEKLKVLVGLSIQGNMSSSAKFHFYPRVELSYQLYNNMIVPYAGLRGGLKRNNWESSFTDNAFISSDIELRNTNEKLEAYGGLKGTLSSSTSFNLMVSSKKVEDFLLFVNDTIDNIGHRYKTIYDSGRTLTVSGEINYHKGTNREIYLRGDWFDYGFSSESPWNLPSYKISSGVRLLVAKKFVVGSEVYYVGNRLAKVLKPANIDVLNTEQEIDLDGFADINLEVEYRYTKRLSAFVRGNNLANLGYQRWYGYNQMPLTILGGFTYKF